MVLLLVCLSDLLEEYVTHILFCEDNGAGFLRQRVANILG